MEDLGALDIEDASVDVVISNCVLNLAPDKGPVFAEIDRVLKAGRRALRLGRVRRTAACPTRSAATPSWWASAWAARSTPRTSAA